MRTITVKHLVLVATFVMLGSALAIAQREVLQGALPSTTEQSLTGTVTCTGRLTHQYSCQRNQTLQTCTLACVQRGSQFVLLAGDNPYILEGKSRDLEGYAGGKATVTGIVSNDHIQVHTVSNPKRELAVSDYSNNVTASLK
jgi:hypothetical protein